MSPPLISRRPEQQTTPRLRCGDCRAGPLWEQRTTPPSISIFESPSMMGLSLQCGDCGALLKSVEEAQDHTELTSHTNFFESTEAVLNLACGKPCRSKAETDLHTKRTGHVNFTDKTMEAAKPIELEASKAAAVAMDMDASAAGGESSDQPQDMVVPNVDKSLFEQLESMGFPLARATRALHYSES